MNPTPHGQVPEALTYERDRASHGQANALRTQQPAPATQQAGWKLVPMVPTAAMVDAGCPVGEMVDHFDMATAYRSMLAAAPQHSPTAQATPAGADVRRSDLVPGVMHCAKCKFQLNRVTLCVSDGNAYAGDNKTEPCPNGCGPLWPVTWEQEARNCWKTLEEMHERLQAAESVPAVDGALEVADAMADSQYLAGVSAGWNAANADDPNAALQKLHESRAGYLKPLSAARAPADSVPASVDTSVGLIGVT